MSHGKYSMFEPVEMGDETKEYFRTIRFLRLTSITRSS